MALHWNWDCKIGELLIRQGEQEFIINVYQGNALAIFIYEFKDEKGVEKYQVQQFFCDKEHFRNCAREFNYAEDWVKLTLWKVPKDFWVLLKDLVKRDVVIEIRGGKKEDKIYETVN